MNEISPWLSIGFAVITGVTVFFFWKATKHVYSLVFILAVLLLSGVLANAGFYNQPSAIPPRLPLIILPAIGGILFIFFSKYGRRMLDRIDYEILTYMHVVRIPVELTILALFTFGLMPESMTFEGRNFDVLSGISAPFIAYFGYRLKTIPSWTLIIWNIVCLILVLQVVITGILASPGVFQQIEFEQPNVAVLLFPFVWLPAIVVPLVILAHIASIKKLLAAKTSS